MMDVTRLRRHTLYFSGIVEKAQQEKQEWFKHEVTRETVPSQPPKSQSSDGQRSTIRHDASAAALLFLSPSKERNALSLFLLRLPNPK